MKRGKVKTSSTEKLLEKLFELLNEAKDEKVIVEGKRDKVALKNLGFEKVWTINRNKSLYYVASGFEGSVLVLTDFDPEGEKLAKKLTRYLVKMGCKVDKKKRKKLRRIFLKNKLNTIEGIKKLV